MFTLKKIITVQLAVVVILTMDAPAQQTKQSRKPLKKSETSASELPPNWTEIEKEFDSIMQNAVDSAISQYEKELQKEYQKKRFWKQAAITEACIIATGLVTGITVYSITRQF